MVIMVLSFHEVSAAILAVSLQLELSQPESNFIMKWKRLGSGSTE